MGRPASSNLVLPAQKDDHRIAVPGIVDAIAFSLQYPQFPYTFTYRFPIALKTNGPPVDADLDPFLGAAVLKVAEPFVERNPS